MRFLGIEEMNTLKERIAISIRLLHYGIFVNLKSGRLYYIPYQPKCVCKSLQLIRHGETVAIEKGEFMSNDSANSRLTDKGRKELEKAVRYILDPLPDIILVGPLQRTISTYEVLCEGLLCKPKVRICEYLTGINNSVWGGKTFEKLSMDDLCVFLQRECNHNIFAKTKDGDSWGDVLIRCDKLLKEIKDKYTDKKILLISQGSVYQGIKILLHQEKKPWDDYAASTMFGIIGNNVKQIGYGRIFNIC